MRKTEKQTLSKKGLKEKQRGIEKVQIRIYKTQADEQKDMLNRGWIFQRPVL